MNVKLLDTALLDEVYAEAVVSPRGRKNRNFHPDNEYPGHRLLNAIEPGSYIAPHRHLDPTKDETMVVLRGSLGLVIFNDTGKVVQKVLLEAGGPTQGVDIPHGTYHTLFALVPGSVFLEAKSGPYAMLTEDERATWAPAEGAPEAADYLAQLVREFVAA